MSRPACLGLAAAVVAAGLLLRLPAWGLPLPVHHTGGGVLWGMMLFLLVAAVRPPGWGPGACAAAALALAAGIEASRLVHAPALDAFRAGLLGQLLLGRIFSAWNGLAYAAGVLAVAALTRRRFGRAPR